VMRVIRNVAVTGRTVLCTIHQPSAEVFLGFDNLLLLQPGGATTYHGLLGKEGGRAWCRGHPEGYQPGFLDA